MLFQSDEDYQTTTEKPHSILQTLGGKCTKMLPWEQPIKWSNKKDNYLHLKPETQTNNKTNHKSTKFQNSSGSGKTKKEKRKASLILKNLREIRQKHKF